MAKRISLIVIVLILFAVFVPFFSKNMTKRSDTEKLGYTPQGKIYRSVLGEYRWFMGDYLAFKSIIYYGSQVEKLKKRKFSEIEFYNLYRTIETAALLNPYHEDVYYFAQAAFTWGIGRVEEVNELLKYVMDYRDWDHRIPFFLGFNYSYFLNDYDSAASYFKKAAEISGSPLFTKLAARYFYEGGKTDLGIIFLEYMYKNAQKQDIKKSYQLRLDALRKIKNIQNQVNNYKSDFGEYPEDMQALVNEGYLKKIPADPYGGTFYLTKEGKVRTTSKLSVNKGG